MNEFVFIVYGMYIENGQQEFDILCVTKSEDTANQAKQFNSKPGSGYTSVYSVTYDIE